MLAQRSISPPKTPKMHETLSGEAAKISNENQSTVMVDERRYGLGVTAPLPATHQEGVGEALKQHHRRLIGKSIHDDSRFEDRDSRYMHHK